MVTTHDSSFGSELPVDARLGLDPADLRGTAARLRSVHADPAQAEGIRSAARAYAENYARGCRGMLANISKVCREQA
jgi:hypothetical protein